MIDTGIVIPTNDPDRFISDFLPTLVNLETIKSRVKLLINFQFPWDTDKIEYVIKSIEDLNFSVSYLISEARSPVNIGLLREQCARLDKDLEFYIITDDDFKYSSGTPSYPRDSGTRYLECLDYLYKYPQCGGVTCMGVLGGYHQQYIIKPVTGYMYATSRGLILRNFSKDISKGLLLPPESHGNLGGLEESVMVFWRFEQGLFFSKQLNNPTIHWHPSKIDINLDENDMHNLTLISSGHLKFIRERYDDESWFYESKRLPKGCVVEYTNKSGNLLDIVDKFNEDYV